jgi:uncharacterized protein
VIRAVVEPSVLVSALVGSATAGPGRLVDAWQEDRFVLIVSPALIAELSDVLGREKFGRHTAEGRGIAYIQDFAINGDHHPDPSEPARVVRDPSDDYLVALARAANADALVSVDKDLLDLEVDDLTICSPRAFLDMLIAADG